MSRILAFALCCVTFGCSSPVEPVLVGRWGGLEASVTLSLDGGSVAYACGDGTIDSGWTLTADGTFQAAGSHRFGGGPLPVDGRPEYPARYRGEVVGDRLSLSVTVLVGNETTSLGPFALYRNGPAVLDQCK